MKLENNIKAPKEASRKPNMQPKKVIMPELLPSERIKNWDEVTLGYSEEDAITEAKRCINCKHRPCVKGCPVSVNIPEFLNEAAKGNFIKANEIIKQTNALPAICGRVCPQETQCEQKCVRGIKGEPVAIGRLERFCADYAAAHDENTEKNTIILESNGIKVAIIGAGPAGLSCAEDLAKMGYDVTIFEALHTPGGVLMYGIPEFRLPKEVVSREVKKIEDLGVKIEVNMVIGRVLSIDELFDMGFQAIFVASGAGLPNFLGIPGENGVGVYSANEFLTRVNLMKAYLDEYDTPIRNSKNTAVVGGGNVAMDAARCAKRLGTENVYIVYRRGESEMPARLEEIHHAKEEGIIFKTLTNPVKINQDSDGNVISMTCVKMELGEPDASGRRRPVPIEGSDFDIDIDTAIIAVGTSPNPLIRMTTPGIETDKYGCLIVRDDEVSTTREGVFAGGDIVSGAATVILAMGAGKKAAVAIDKYIKSKQ